MKATVKKDEFKRIIKALKPFISGYQQADIKMRHIHFEVDSSNSNIKFEALDGHRIAIENIKCDADENFNGYIKPIMLGKTSFGDICTIEKDSDTVYIEDLDCRYKIKQPNGEWYPTDTTIQEYEQRAPKEVGINAKYLIDALKNQVKTGGRDLVKIEIREPEDPIIIRSLEDERNMRIILPVRMRER